MKTRIVLVDDHRVFREGLRALLSNAADMEVIGEAENGLTAIQLVSELQPDVVIMDIRMPELNGIEATREIKARVPAVKVIALSMHSDKRFVSGMFGAGASGYLPKACAFEEVVAAVRAVVQNRYYTSPKISDTVIGEYVRQLAQAASSADTSLSTREREVLQLLAEGHNTKEVARRLHISGGTVDTHRSHVMNKLGIDNLADLVKYALREGLTTLDA